MTTVSEISFVRCQKCGSAVKRRKKEEYLTLSEIMRRYKIKRTKALQIRNMIRRTDPDAIRSHGRCVRVAASVLDRLWRTH